MKKHRHIPTTAVKSSAIASIGHDPVTNTLRVEFSSGHSYDYPDVSAEEHAALMKAESTGKHFHKHFRGRDCSKVYNEAA
jgi:KTSC domain